MADTDVISVANTTSSKAKKSGPKGKGSKGLPATHPPTSTMVSNAIKNLKERGGSSSQAIKKYISSTYKVDAEKIAPFIKKYLKTAADKGLLIRTKGKGASGSFKLAGASQEGEKLKSKKPKSNSKPKQTKVTGTGKKLKKTVKPKGKKPKSAKKTASKAKKTTKAPAAKKLKTPKPKKAKKPVLK